MKHRNITRSTCHIPGYTEPQPPKSKKGGGYPHRQPFDAKLRFKNK